MAGQRQWPSGPSPWGRAGIPRRELSKNGDGERCGDWGNAVKGEHGKGLGKRGRGKDMKTGKR